MVEPESDENTCHEKESDAPGIGDVSAALFQIACQHDEQALSCYIGYAVECAPDTYEKGLSVTVKSEHVETVGSNVVGGRAESHQPEYG